jgi:hypothetical protein
MPLDGDVADHVVVVDPVLKALVDGRDLIVSGWCQGNTVLVNPNTHAVSYCIIGAVQDYQAQRELFVAAYHHEAPAYRPVYPHLTSWNDRLSRQKHEVVALFDAAIERRIGG